MSEVMENYNFKSVNNSEIFKHTLISLINVASLKTSNDYAWSSIKKLIKELQVNYDFLMYIHIADIEDLRYSFDDINIVDKINNVDPKKIGEVIQDLVDLLKKYLGKRAGYFFISEFREILGDDYHKILKDMGVDLRLIELQHELKGMNSGEYHLKDDHNSNIAFIHKKERK